MDDVDRSLIALLRENARQPTALLARKLGIARATVQARLQRLEERGIVRGYTVRLGEAFERRRIRAHVMLDVAPKLAARAEDALARMPEVRALYAISGLHDLIAIVATESTEEMNRLLDRIGALPGVERTTSSVLLAAKVDR